MKRVSLTAVEPCPVCGESMSTAVTCEGCGFRMCVECGVKHECPHEQDLGHDAWKCLECGRLHAWRSKARGDDDAWTCEHCGARHELRVVKGGA